MPMPSVRLHATPSTPLALGRNTSGQRSLICRSQSGLPAAASAPALSSQEKEALLARLDDACKGMAKAPPSQKMEYSADVSAAWSALGAGGAVPKWGSITADSDMSLKRRNVGLGELRQVGIKSPDKIAMPSVRNDAAFLFTVVGVTSVMAVAAQVLLPGEWGFWGTYLSGGISIAVLAVGSTAPGLLAVAIDAFSQVYPDYKDRVLGHEAGHFLAGYLLGIPVTGYSVQLGKEHTEFAEAKLQKRIIERTLEDPELDLLAVMAVAGVAAEGRVHEEIMGQTADLTDLQRLMLRSRMRLSDSSQQALTRWAVWRAAGLLRAHAAEHEALIEAMRRGASVAECAQAIEGARAASS